MTTMVRTRPVTRYHAWGRRLLIGAAVTYVVFLILAPLAALITGAFQDGLGAVVNALSQPDVRQAFWLTLIIALITVIVHAVCGTAVAWVLVRHRFPGRRLLNGLIAMPFAVSAVVGGRPSGE